MQECVKAAAGGARVHGGFDETAELWRNSIAGLALTILLYFGGEPDVVRIVHPGERPAVKSKLERRDPERFRDLREPTHYAVGKEFSRPIERWEIGHRGDPGVETGRTMRPHMRNAHSHLYWTGPARTQPRTLRANRSIDLASPRITSLFAWRRRIRRIGLAISLALSAAVAT